VVPLIDASSGHGTSNPKSSSSDESRPNPQSQSLLGDALALVLADSTWKRCPPVGPMSWGCRSKSLPPRSAVRSPRDRFGSNEASTSKTSRAVRACAVANTSGSKGAGAVTSPWFHKTSSRSSPTASPSSRSGSSRSKYTATTSR